MSGSTISGMQAVTDEEIITAITPVVVDGGGPGTNRKATIPQLALAVGGEVISEAQQYAGAASESAGAAQGAATAAAAAAALAEGSADQAQQTAEEVQGSVANAAPPFRTWSAISAWAASADEDAVAKLLVNDAGHAAGEYLNIGGVPVWQSDLLSGVDARVETVETKLPTGPSRHGRRDIVPLFWEGVGENRFRAAWTYADGADAGKFDADPSAPFIENVTAPLAAEVAPALIFSGKLDQAPTRHGRQQRALALRWLNSAGQPWLPLDTDPITGKLVLDQTPASQKANTYPTEAIYARERMYEMSRILYRISRGLSGICVLAIYGDSWTGAASYYVEDLTTALQGMYGDAGRGWYAFAFGSTTDNTAASYTGAGAIVDATGGGTDGTLTRTTGWTKSYTAASPDGGAVMSSTAGAKITLTGKAGQTVAHLYGSGGVVQYRFNGGSWTTITYAGTGIERTVLAGVPGIDWSLEVKVVSGSVVLHGLEMRTAATHGVRVLKLGKGGTHSGTWANLVNRTAMVAGLTLLAPTAYTCMLGVNDQWLGDAVQTMPAVYKTNGAEIISRFREATPTADIMMVTSPEVRVEGYRMTAYEDAWRALAMEQKVAHVRMGPFFGDALDDYKNGAGRELLDPSLIHPSTAGGQALVAAFMRAMPIPHPIPGVTLP